MKLLINLDDFGYTRGVSKAILELLKGGYAKSTTVMANFVNEEDLKELANIKNISVGLHFVINVGKASRPSTLTTNGMSFKVYSEDISKIKINEKDLKEELVSQYKILSKHLNVTHVDSHKHTHIRNKNVNNVVREFAKENNLQVRENRHKNSKEKEKHIPIKNGIEFGTRYYINSFYKKGIHKLNEYLNPFKDREVIVEIMAHPGYNDGELENRSSYSKQREEEIKKIKEIKDNYEIISYHDIKGEKNE